MNFNVELIKDGITQSGQQTLILSQRRWEKQKTQS